MMLLTVLVLSSSILGASAIAGYLMLLSIRGATDLASSAKAIIAADAGLEWELYRFFRNDPGYPAPVFLNNAIVASAIESVAVAVDQSQLLENSAIFADSGSQSFTTGSTVINVKSTEIKLGATISGVYLIQFTLRLAADNVFVASVNTTASLTPTPSAVTADFGSPLTINSNTRYLIEWQKIAESSPDGSLLSVRYKTADPYVGGAFSIDPLSDIYFRTFHERDRKISSRGRAENVFRAFELRLAGATTTLP